MDLYDLGSYEVQLLKLPPLQPSVELRRQLCASAAERRAPIAVPPAHDRTSRMQDLERFLGQSALCEQSMKPKQHNKLSPCSAVVTA